MHVWALGLSCETPAAPPDRAAGARTRQPENSKRAHFRAPALQNTTKNSTRRPPERHRNSETVAGKGRKSAKFWAPPPFGAPPFRGPTLRGPTLQGPTLRGPIFPGLGSHLSGPPRSRPTPFAHHSRFGLMFFFVPFSIFLFCPNVVFFVPFVIFYFVPNVVFFCPVCVFFVPFVFFFYFVPTTGCLFCPVSVFLVPWAFFFVPGPP